LTLAQAASGALVAGATTGAARAAAFAAALNAQHAAGAGAAKSGIVAGEKHFESELEINDFPQQARWKVTHKDSLSQICEFTGAAITTRGQYYAPGKPVPPGERKLYLLIEGPTERCVQNGKQKLKETIEAEVNRQALPGGFTVGKYKV
jgi:ATP-dependent RNA helicase DDX46/PRP5